MKENRKLQLNKETVAKLNDRELNLMKGGITGVTKNSNNEPIIISFTNSRICSEIEIPTRLSKCICSLMRDCFK